MKTFPLTEKQTAYFLNIAKNSKSGFIGVTWYNPEQKWKAHIQHMGQNFNLGLFDNPVDAAIARDKKAMSLWGENAVTNDKLGLLSENDRGIWMPDDVEKIKSQINQSLPKHLIYFGRLFFVQVSLARERGLTFAEAMRQEPKLNTLSKKDRTKILMRLKQERFIIIDEQNKNSVDKNRVYSASYPPNQQLIKESEMAIKKDTSMTLQKQTSLENKSPEELLAMAEELKKLSEAKKQEIANGDVIRKTLRPLVLNAFQAKGKFERKLNELLDVSTELDNALNALRDAMK